MKSQFKITCKTGETVPITIQTGFKDLVSFLNEKSVGKKLFVITNERVKTLYFSELESAFKHSRFQIHCITVPDSEEAKSLAILYKLIDDILPMQIERKDTILALGGGIVGDLGGFLSSILLRGINFIQCPTSLLAQVDAAIGGKTGINHPIGKNLIGTFYHPLITYINSDTLHTLPPREMRCGLAEIIKYGVIMDPDTFNLIEANLDKLALFQYKACPMTWQKLIENSCRNKADVVSKDEKESHLRAILNYGHTVGHAIESVLKYGTFSHGECVAMGMHVEAKIAVKLGLFSQKDFERQTAIITALGYPLHLKNANWDLIQSKMIYDKKVKDGKVMFVLPTSIGTTTFSQDVPAELILDCLKELA